MQNHHARLRRQPVVHRAVITEADRKRVEREKVDRFISGAQCRRIDLDQEIDGRTDRVRCEEGEERCDVCQKSDNMMEEAEALRQAYIAEQEEGRQHETVLDSGIDMPSSQFVIRSSSPGMDQASSAPVIHSSPGMDQASSPLVVRSSSPGIDPPSSPLVVRSSRPLEASSPPVVHSRSLEASIVEEVEFQNQQTQYKQAQAYAQSQAQEECWATWELEQQLEEWGGQCPLCFIKRNKTANILLMIVFKWVQVTSRKVGKR